MPRKERPKTEKILAFNIPVIYEDEDIVVIDKPCGVVVNKSSTIPNDYTVQDWFEDYYFSKVYGDKIKDLAENDNKSDIEIEEALSGGFYDRCGIVHRIDKDTSGLLLLAKTPDAFDILQTQFKNRKVKKEYTALVIGKVREFAENKEIIINAPLGRNPHSREKFAIVENGREAETLFKLIKFVSIENAEYTLIKCFPKSGRTHQIRVHLTALGYPIAGDKLYSGRNQLKSVQLIIPRQMLHATNIKITHPTTKKKIEFESPLPQEFLELL